MTVEIAQVRQGLLVQSGDTHAPRGRRFPQEAVPGQRVRRMVLVEHELADRVGFEQRADHGGRLAAEQVQPLPLGGIQGLQPGGAG